MKISATPKNASLNFKGNIYNSPLLIKSAKFANDNSALFCAGVSLALSSVIRPVAIMMTPKTKKENKKYAAAKSIASSATGYLLMAAVSKPFSSAISKIDSDPKKYLKETTIKNLASNSENLTSSRRYQFATQLFKLGLGCLIAIPKSTLTSFLIPKILGIFPNKEKKKEEKKKEISFKGSIEGIKEKTSEKLTQGISGIINEKATQRLASKFEKTNFEQNFMFLSDFALTYAFVKKTKKNEKIEEERKKPLIYNSILSTAFSTISSFSANKLIDKKFQKFLGEFRAQNKNNPDLEKCVNGLNIAKLALITGGIYYIIIPIISTFLSEKIQDKIDNNH